MQNCTKYIQIFLVLVAQLSYLAFGAIDCDNIDDPLCTDEGRWVRRLLNNYHGVNSLADCRTLCKNSYKCDKFSYRAQAKLCKAFDDPAIPLSRDGWIRSGCYSSAPCGGLCTLSHANETVCYDPTNCVAYFGGAGCYRDDRVVIGECNASGQCEDHCPHDCWNNEMFCPPGTEDQFVCVDDDCQPEILTYNLADPVCPTNTTLIGKCAPQSGGCCDNWSDPADGCWEHLCVGQEDLAKVCRNDACEVTVVPPANSCPQPFNQVGQCNPGGTCVTCFAASSIVNVFTKDGTKEIRADELQLGDKVLSADQFGNLFYDEVFFEYHPFPTRSFDTDISVLMLRIAYDGGFLDITETHLLYLSSNSLQRPIDRCLMGHVESICLYRGGLASIGDRMWIADTRDNFKLVQKNITQITQILTQVRSPKTLQGSMIVNNVLISCYTEHHDTNAASYFLIRVIYHLFPSILQMESFVSLWQQAELFSIPETLALRFPLFAQYGAVVLYSLQTVFILIVVCLISKMCLQKQLY